MLHKINGINLELLPFQNLKLISDLIYFDGPLLSYFQDKQNRKIIYYWCDANETCNRWLVMQVSPQNLSAYQNQKISLHSLILSPVNDIICVVDVDNNLNNKQILKITPDQLPESYTPEEDSFYDDSLSVEYTKEKPLSFGDIRVQKFGEITKPSSLEKSMYTLHTISHWQSIVAGSQSARTRKSMVKTSNYQTLKGPIAKLKTKVFA